MPVEPTTIYFEDYLSGEDSLSNYEPYHYAAAQQAALADNSFSFRRERDDEGFIRYLPGTSFCPGVIFDEGEANAECQFGRLFIRREPVAASGDWYHARVRLRISGDWNPPRAADDFRWKRSARVFGILVPETSVIAPVEEPFVGTYAFWETVAAFIEIGEFFAGDDEGNLADDGAGGFPRMNFGTFRHRYGFGMTGVNLANLSGHPQHGGMVYDEWYCIEIAVGEVDVERGSGRGKVWVNDVLFGDQTWDFAAQVPPYSLRPGKPTGFVFGDMSSLLQGTSSLYIPTVNPRDGLWYGSGLMEHSPAREDGVHLDFSRVASADGPIGCFFRGGGEEEPPLDPDARRCRDDSYDTDCELRGECGRVVFNTGGLTREAAGWETAGNGFLSAKSSWYRWVAPRDGRFVFRTRGSQVFNEVGVYRHTGALPPPLVSFSGDDPWQPEETVGAAVAIDAVKDVEYRIRVASASDGWVVLDFGPPWPIITDDGWTINESERETRSRVSVAGTVTGLAIEDDQVAVAANGAGAERTLDGVLWGALA